MATYTYTTHVRWMGGHRGHLKCGNGAEMDFSAPPKLYGEEGVLTPEDAFLAAVNTCYHMMLVWAAERLHLDMVSYECEAEGVARDRLDKTSEFESVVLRPKVVVRGASYGVVEKALRMARKYSLIAESIKPEVIIQPDVSIQEPSDT